MFKLLIFIQCILFIFTVTCTEKIVGDGDCFDFSGVTYNAADSSKLKKVTVCLTDFMGNFETPISEVFAESDSNGTFSLFKCPGYKEVQKWNGTEIFKFDSCKAVFSKTGYNSDTIIIRNNNTNSSFVQNVYLVPSQK
jgi:hypothetical protein